VKKAHTTKNTEPVFSLAEIMIALGMLAGLTLVVFALFLQLVRGAEKQENLAAGAVLAQEVLTERLQTIFDNAEPGLSKEDFFSQDSPPLAPLEGTVALGTTTFTYRINHKTLSDSSGTPIGGDPVNNNRLKRVDITVWWWNDDPNESRFGQGFLRTEASRFINEKTDFNV